MRVSGQSVISVGDQIQGREGTSPSRPFLLVSAKSQRGVIHSPWCVSQTHACELI